MTSLRLRFFDNGQWTNTDLVSQDIGEALDDAFRFNGFVILEGSGGFQVWLDSVTMKYEIRQCYETHPPTTR